MNCIRRPATALRAYALSHNHHIRQTLMLQNDRNDLTDEDDEEYTPPMDGEGLISAPSYESDEESRSHRVKRARTSTNDDTEPTLNVPDRKQKDAQLWSDFLNSASTSTPSSSTNLPMVKVEMRHRFAGKDIVEVKDVPEDSDEAKKWPRLSQSAAYASTLGSETTTSPKLPPLGTSLVAGPSTKLKEPSQSPSDKSPKLTKRPGPRKSKIVLGQPTLAQAQARKISTLDKSAMDWNSFVYSEDSEGERLQDNLAANRRGGGFLEKQDFLQRIDDRKNEVYEANKGKRRRL